jgi:hypothetical protein
MDKRMMKKRTSMRDRSLPKSVDEERDRVHWPEPISEAKLEKIREVLDRLASDGLIYDTGRRRFSPRTGRFEIVWAAVPAVDKQN